MTVQVVDGTKIKDTKVDISKVDDFIKGSKNTYGG